MDNARLRRVTARMKEAGLDQILVTATTSLFYLTGHWVEPHERMIALLLDAGGSAVLFGNEIFGLTSQPGLPFVAHKDGDDPVAQLAQAVKPGKLGIDKFWYSKFLIGLMTHRPDVVPVHGMAAPPSPGLRGPGLHRPRAAPGPANPDRPGAGAGVRPGDGGAAIQRAGGDLPHPRRHAAQTI